MDITGDRQRGRAGMPEVEDVQVERGSFSFECMLRGNSEPWGMTLDCWLDGWQVISIAPGGFIDEYNRSTTEDRRILVHDFITHTNTFRDLERMYEEMQKVQRLKLCVVRPSCRAVRVDKGTNVLGLNVGHQATVSSCMQINSVSEDGAAAEHNKGCAEDARLHPNDYIERVNNIYGSADDMIEEILNSTVVDLSVLRLPAPNTLQIGSPMVQTVTTLSNF